MSEETSRATRTDAELCHAVAMSTGQLLSGLSASGLLCGRGLGRAGDLVAHQWICAVLAEQRPDDAVLSEEGAATRERLEGSRVWIVDPLDGTREYGEGRADWAVHVALIVDGTPAHAAVALPGTGAVLSTVEPVVAGAWRRGGVRIAVSRSRPPALAEAVAARLDAELVPMGSAGYKAMAVVRGEVDAYLHAGGQYEWDSAAPVGVATAAGLHASRIDGSPLTYNNPQPELPDLLICRPELAGELLEAIAA